MAAPTAGRGGLNGAFLSSYDGRQAEPGATRPPRRNRGEQLLDEDRLVELQAAAAGRDARLPSFELILDASNLLPFDFLRTGDRLGRAVLKIQRADGAAGTGIPRRARHPADEPPRPARRGHRRRGQGRRQLRGRPPPTTSAGRPASTPLDPKALFLTNPDLDFTFCAVAGLDFLGVVPLSRNSLNIMRSEYVNIIQHPRGRPKEIVLQDNRVVRADNVVLQYSCDTEPGSSGSPVFNNQWKLVALHHASVVVDGPDGRHAPDADPGSRYLNEGIRLSAIATWLETAEANAPGGREAVARLRAAFRGLDPQIGFFGALGRRSDGKGAAEVVVESVPRRRRRPGPGLLGPARVRPRLPRPPRTRSPASSPRWGWTSGAWPTPGSETVRALCEHLETNFQLEYAAMVDPDGDAGGRWRSSTAATRA